MKDNIKKTITMSQLKKLVKEGVSKARVAGDKPTIDKPTLIKLLRPVRCPTRPRVNPDQTIIRVKTEEDDVTEYYSIDKLLKYIEKSGLAEAILKDPYGDELGEAIFDLDTEVTVAWEDCGSDWDYREEVRATDEKFGFPVRPRRTPTDECDDLVVKEEFGDDETIPGDQVNEFEDHLRTAQKEVEAAARIVCSSHNPAAIQAWRKLNNMSEDISEVIHSTHLFRKWD